MKIALQYLTDQSGATQAVQLPLADWERVMKRLSKYEQALRLKADLQEAVTQVAKLRKSGKSKETLSSFVNEL